ncbi:MAG: hypothetical protein P8X68_19350 [Desulfobacterales bacterium]|jgi:hypothetical protein
MTKDIYELETRQQFVWVKDNAGNQYVCPVDVLKKADQLTEEERKHCIDDASVYQASAGG